MNFNDELLFIFDEEKMNFQFSDTLFFPKIAEKRYLDEVRSSMYDANSFGPKVLYSIAMDVGKKKDKKDLFKRNLLYGLVAYNKGLVGNELVHSQGHIHAVSRYSGSSTPEVYQILQGSAFVYMQNLQEEMSPSYVVKVYSGEIVIVPPGWAHYAVNADPTKVMIFGAWCVRDYSFEYERIRENRGLSYYPMYKGKETYWLRNKNYVANELIIKEKRDYKEFGITQESIYRQYEEDHDRFNFVVMPQEYSKCWVNFVP